MTNEEAALQLIQHYYSLIREALGKHESSLRFNTSFLTVSEISKQYYCEKKVEMERVLGKIVTEHKVIGQEAHEILLKNAVKVKQEEIFRKILSGKPMLIREMLLLAKIKDVIIAGRPDAIFFYSGNPLCLFEYKFKKHRFPFRDMHVQARLYCLLLNEMGFTTEKLRYSIMLVPPKFRKDEEIRRLPLFIIKHILALGGHDGKRDYAITLLSPKIMMGKAMIFINDFNKSEALKDLEWALEYWLNKREAKPTSKTAKCKSCEYVKQCSNTSR
jgi:CRISPR/Cas system-associated exonuclease Cas4 (RecB family)